MAKCEIRSTVKPPASAPQADRLLGDLRQMIEAARARVATAANAELTFLYWRIGRRARSEILAGKRASYGEAIVATVSQRLVVEYRRGFTCANLTRVLGFFAESRHHPVTPSQRVARKASKFAGGRSGARGQRGLVGPHDVLSTAAEV